MRIIGVDYGLSRTGLAIWDSQADLVLPLEVIAEKDLETAVRKIASVCIGERADLVVVGYPKGLSGETTGEQVVRTERFADLLRHSVSCPVEFEDERLSSGMAVSQKHHGGQSTADRDALAAASILESYIERNAEEE